MSAAVETTMPIPIAAKLSCARCSKEFKISKYTSDVLCTFCYNVGHKWSFAPLIPTAWVALPAGKYYIGDLCYVSDDGVSYDSAWGAFDWNGFEDGLYSSTNGSFMAASTAYGDGGFEDSWGNSYGVDGGNISIANVKLLPEDWHDNYLGKVFDFPNGVQVRMTGRLGGSDKANGQFEFKWKDESGEEQILKIDTASFEEEDEE